MLRSDIHIRDPFVLVHDGTYYLYGTRGPTCWGEADGFDVYVGTDLENWDGPYECFHNDGSFWATKNYWAPEVHPWQGKFYMFASFKKDGVCRGTSILVADSPMGPFRPHTQGNITPADWECLDGTFYVDRKGQPWMVFCHEWVQVGDGEIWAMRLSDDLTRLTGEKHLLFKASSAPWKRPGHPINGEPSYVTDGPFLWRTQNGSLICLWASFSKDGYTEGQAVSDNGDIDGRFTQQEPLFRKDGGHAMVFRALDGHLMMALHSPNDHPHERPRFIHIHDRGDILTDRYMEHK